MAILIQAIVYYLFLIDSVGALLMAWFGDKWYKRNFRIFSRYFPPSKGWCTYYFLLILWIGYLYNKLGLVP
jgi:hypothetical protein